MYFMILTFFTITFLTSVAQADFSGVSSSNLSASESQGAGNTETNASAEREMNMFDNSKLEKLRFNFGNAQAWLTPPGRLEYKGYGVT